MHLLRADALDLQSRIIRQPVPHMHQHVRILWRAIRGRTSDLPQTVARQCKLALSKV